MISIYGVSNLQVNTASSQTLTPYIYIFISRKIDHQQSFHQYTCITTHDFQNNHRLCLKFQSKITSFEGNFHKQCQRHYYWNDHLTKSYRVDLTHCCCTMSQHLKLGNSQSIETMWCQSLTKQSITLRTYLEIK